jgi:hypothetical protein
VSGRPSQPAAGARLRRGRLALALCSLLCTVLVAAAGVGLLPTPQTMNVAVAQTAPDEDGAGTRMATDGPTGGGAFLGAALSAVALGPSSGAERRAAGVTPALPSRSGRGERVVFDESTQHVWLVDESGTVLRDYPVSGSLTDNLEPGVYAVYSRSRHATSFDRASTMEFMVRFTHGNSAAIGFHSIPVDNRGRRLQTFAELGTPQSHGCIRQRRSDAIALWRFAELGTKVAVV